MTRIDDLESELSVEIVDQEIEIHENEFNIKK
jgi:hypothetical protein